jgi:hypothetical protein
VLLAFGTDIVFSHMVVQLIQAIIFVILVQSLPYTYRFSVCGRGERRLLLLRASQSSSSLD